MFNWFKKKKNAANDAGAGATVSVSATPAAYAELNDALTAYLAATQKVLTRFDDVPHHDPFQTDALRSLARQAMELALKGGDSNQLNFAINRLAEGVANPDPYQASRAAILIGALVERGGSPTRALPAVLARTPELLSHARELFDVMQAEYAGLESIDDAPPEGLARYFETMPDGVKAVRGLPLLLRPAMTMLCRDVPARIAARQNADLTRTAADMEEIQSEAGFLHQVLQLTDDVPFLVLHARQKKGFRVRVTGVQNNFHLFTLLQGELVGPGKITGPPPNKEVVTVARGEAPLTRPLKDNAAFGYFHYLGLQADGMFDIDKPLASWLWGEMPAWTTPQWENTHIVLLDKLPLQSRSWDSGFFAPLHDALRSFVVIEETLLPDEVDALMGRLTHAACVAAAQKAAQKKD